MASQLRLRNKCKASVAVRLGRGKIAGVLVGQRKGVGQVRTIRGLSRPSNRLDPTAPKQPQEFSSSPRKRTHGTPRISDVSTPASCGFGYLHQFAVGYLRMSKRGACTSVYVAPFLAEVHSFDDLRDSSARGKPTTEPSPSWPNPHPNPNPKPTTHPVPGPETPKVILGCSSAGLVCARELADDHNYKVTMVDYKGAYTIHDSYCQATAAVKTAGTIG